MLKLAQDRYRKLQDHLNQNRIPMTVLIDESSIAYYTGFWEYLGIEFGQLTLLCSGRTGDSIYVTESCCEYLTDYSRGLQAA